MADHTTVTTHRTPAGMQVDPAGTDTTYTKNTTRSGGSSFGFLVGAGLAVVALLLLFLFLAGPEDGETVGTGGDVATESVVVPEDGSTAPVDQSVAPEQGDAAPATDDAAPAADDDAAAPADDTSTTAN